MLGLVLAGCAAPAPVERLALSGIPEASDAAPVPLASSALGVAVITARRGSGAGFFVTAAGHLLTTRHLVADTDILIVRLSDGRQFPALLLREDAARDVALLKISAPSPMVLPVRAGVPAIDAACFALAPASRLGAGAQPSAGRVTGSILGATPAGPQPWLLATPPVEPGGSGGPLLDANGNVLGIARESGEAGVGRFIPIGDALDRLGVTLQAGG